MDVSQVFYILGIIFFVLLIVFLIAAISFVVFLYMKVKKLQTTAENKIANFMGVIASNKMVALPIVSFVISMIKRKMQKD